MRRSPRPRLTLAGLSLAAMLVGATFGLDGCLTPIPATELAQAGPALDPLGFFDGRLTSWGVLESRGGSPNKTFHVDTAGERRADGVVAIAQTIHWSDGKVDRRSWTLSRAPGGGLSADLSDASGPVTVAVEGPMLHLSYPMKSPAGGRMEQRLYLQPDGRALLNEGEVRVIGVTVARISELITREPAAAR